MTIGDYIALGFIIAAAVSIILFLVKQKKKGVKCVGCPYGKKCTTCTCKDKPQGENK